MAYAPKPTRSQPVESLSDKLGRLDINLGKLDSRSKLKPEEIFTLMDEIKTTLDERSKGNISIVAEKSQFDAACATLQKSAGTLLRAVGGAGALASSRSKRNPPPEFWWWWLDKNVAERNKKSVLRATVTAMIVFVIAAAAFFLYDRFLAPSPEVVARYNARQKVMELMQQGKNDDALAAVEKSLQALPQDLELLLMKGIVLQVQGKKQDADVVFNDLRGRYPSLLEFHLSKSQAFLMANRPDLSLIEAQTALTTSPDSAEAYLLLGGAQELSEKFDDALASYSKAAQLAAVQGDMDTEVTAKVRAATLMQRAPAGFFPGSR